MSSSTHTFAFVSLFIVNAFVIAGISSQTEDSYTVGIYRNRNGNDWQTKSKWSKNMVNSDSCGGIFREKQNLIASPGYPNRNYPKNVRCEYVFYSPFVCANEFHVQFLDFQLEPSLSCSKDNLRIGDEVLCGQVVGIMKYKAVNGSLKIQFNTDQTIENKGFELLVTRLPCGTDTVDKSMKPSANLPTTISLTVDSNWTPTQNSIEPIAKQSDESIASNRSPENQSQTTFIKPVCVKKSQAQWNGAWPTDTQWPNAQWPNPYAPLPLPPTSNLPGFLPQPPPTQPSLPSCCINVYNQQTFYLISPGFPHSLRLPADCLFYVERLHANVCRLRIEFKYFLLGTPLEQYQCTHNFLEIDGQRFCGCKTGTFYRTQWGPSPKPIRFTNLVQQPGIQGFVLEITQEPCPYRVRLTNQPSPVRAKQLLSTQNYSTNINDPNRCSYNHLSWINFNTNQDILAKSICIRNFG